MEWKDQNHVSPRKIIEVMDGNRNKNEDCELTRTKMINQKKMIREAGKNELEY